jgi:hypothetical protein
MANEDTLEQARALIESKINLERAKDISVTRTGIDTDEMVKVYEAAKWMAASRYAVPRYLQGNPFDCVDIIIRARDWGFNPYGVAKLTYIVENKRGEVVIAYMSQLVHAIVLARAPLKYRLTSEYEGEGDERTCTITGEFIDNTVRRTYTTPKLGDLKRKMREQQGDERAGRGSPLWFDDPDQQLHYRAVTRWARRWCPDILLGLHTQDDAEDGAWKQIDVTPGTPDDGGLSKRLSEGALQRAGFAAGFAAAEIDGEKGGADNRAASGSSSDAAPEEPTGGGEAGVTAAAASDQQRGLLAGAEATAGVTLPGNGEGRPRASRRRRIGPPPGDDLLSSQ